MAYRVLIYTGDKPKAGTDANVRLILHDIDSVKTPVFKLDAMFRDDFERGKVDEFDISLPKSLKFGSLGKIEFWRDTAGFWPAWYVDKVKVEDKRLNVEYYFPVFRWIKPDHRYIIPHLDTSLPQFDENREQREMELEDKRKIYQLEVKIPGLPAQVKQIPDDEKFAVDYRWDIKKTKYQLGIDKLRILLKSGRWENLGSLKNLYLTELLREPKGAMGWAEDTHFGDQRVADINPVLIKICTAIPDKFGVTEDMLKADLEGMTIEEAIGKKRLFIVDLEIMRDVPCQSDEYTLCAPIALFFQNKANQLVPVAIQLFQDKGPTNPVFLPSDHPMTWLLAKMWYNNADAGYHQAATHLGFTHLMMESIAVITHRNLSQSHPIFKLLAPHFLYLIAINTLGLDVLISKGGWFDKVLSGGITGSFELIRRGVRTWRLDVEGNIPEEIKQRGVLDENVLSFYPYRDDALLIHSAIKNYVTKMVRLYYDTVEKLEGDWELQSWAKEMVKSKENGGAGMLGVPGNGHFTSNDQLILVLASVISTCSISHAAANFPQYETYGYPPNYPMMLTGKPPTDKKPKSEKDILDVLPDKAKALDTMIITTILGQFATNALGDFEVNYIFDPPALEIVESFKAQLAEISRTIKQKNECRRVPYKWLDPEIVPNAISI